MAVAAARRGADADEHDFGGRHRLGEIGVEGQPAFAGVGLDQFVETGFEDRDPPFLEGVDLALVLVDAEHLVAEIGKTRTRDKSDVA
ncbi:hypothetical protein A6302_04440 [Methylobrevis pamukkalensis]|uniref:Uncharacterized protein n=1 Tax=Methylobrevis pamukkalensis TaxID=1439726 RepID=A0A1E3GQU8_9HYPH|nr:hypothetical protein A6302_04440 [Methylobrevis pamukkalensis]